MLERSFKMTFKALLLVIVLVQLVGCGGGGSSSGGSGHSLSGRITLNGVGLSNVSIVNGYTTTVTDSNGYYSFHSLDNRAYYISPTLFGYTFAGTNPTMIPVHISNADQTAIDFIATRETSFSIYGAITKYGFPLQNVTVTLSGNSTASTTTNSSGQFSFSSLTNGNYTITPTLSGNTFSPSSQSLTINGGSVSGYSFTAN